MRKKLFVCLMLMMCILAQAVPVGAVGELTVAQLDALPKPAADAKLISFADLEKTGDTYSFPAADDNGGFYLSNLYGNAKIITYKVDTGEFWCTASSTIETNEGPAPIIELKKFNTFLEALNGASIIEEVDRFYTFADNAYTMFIPIDGSSITDVTCCIQSNQFLSHYDAPAASFNGDGKNTFSVSVLEKYPSEGLASGAKFRLDYVLGGDDFWGTLREEKVTEVSVESINSVHIDSASQTSSGSVEFTIDHLQSKTYSVLIYTDCGNKYTTSFDVDFAGGDTFSKFTGSYDEPIITVDGLPDSSVTGITDPISLTVRSDIPAKLTWGNKLYDSFSKEWKIEVTSNGVYSYSAESEVGQVTLGSVEFTCFVGGTDMSGQDLDISASGLYQTGLTEGFGGTVLVVLVLGAVLLTVGVVFIKRRRSV